MVGAPELVMLVLLLGVVVAACGLAWRAGRFRVRTYTEAEWRVVQGGWWLNALAVLVLASYTLGLYPLFLFTRWLRPTGAPLSKRMWTALGHTLLLFVPFAWLYVVPWSRDRYFVYRVEKARAVAVLAGS